MLVLLGSINDNWRIIQKWRERKMGIEGILEGMVLHLKAETVKHTRWDSQCLDLRWKTWQAGLYDLFVEACSNFFEAASFSTKLFWRKYLIHQDELRNFACKRWTYYTVIFCCASLENYWNHFFFWQ